ncbi:MAG: hypothetical protein Q4B15_08800 [Lachnospiraceae bacterium]|nr:hypothetical protein [Lachnospiraceae bacterium]
MEHNVIFGMAENEEQDFLFIKELLSKNGIHVTETSDYLFLNWSEDSLRQANRHHNSGRPKFVSDYTYIDVLIFKAQRKSEKEILDLLGCKRTTYYDCLKKLKQSYLWEELDKDQLNNIEYLKSFQNSVYNLVFGV